VPINGFLASYKQRCASTVHRVRSIAGSFTSLTFVRCPQTLHALIATLVMMINNLMTVLIDLTMFVLALAGVPLNIDLAPLEERLR
jgi:hypothetical protein